MLKQMTFGRKLALGLGAKALLTIILSAAAVYALRTVTAAKDEVIATQARLLKDAYKLRAVSLDRINQNRGYLLTAADKFRQDTLESRKESEQILEEMRRTAKTQEEVNLLNEIGRASEAQAQAADAIMKARQGVGPGMEKMAAIITDFQRNVVTRNEAFAQALSRFTNLEEKNLEGAKNEASAIARTASWAIIGLALASIVLALFLAVVLTRVLSRQIGSAVQHIQNSASELQAAANQQTAGAKEQVASMTEISTTMKELIATARQIAESAQSVARIADNTSSAADNGDQTVRKAQGEIGAIRKQVDTVVEHMLDLGRKSQQIGGILEIINELAEQTNILAINATIEAAGAGEAGKRFSVVADEIRKLADRVGGSTKEIRSLIDQIRSAVNAAVMATESGSKAVDTGSKQFGEVTAVFSQIRDLLQTTTEAAKEIELSTKQQSSAVEQTDVAIVNVAQASRETETSSGQVLQTVSELATLSKDLGRLVQAEPAAA